MSPRAWPSLRFSPGFLRLKPEKTRRKPGENLGYISNKGEVTRKIVCNLYGGVVQSGYGAVFCEFSRGLAGSSGAEFVGSLSAGSFEEAGEVGCIDEMVGLGDFLEVFVGVE